MGEEIMMTENFFNSLTPHKRLLLGLESKFDYDFALATLKVDYCIESFNLGLKKIDHRVFIESGNSEMLDSLYTEAEKESQPKIIDAIKNMLDKIAKFLRNTVDMIKEKMNIVFGKLTENNLTADEFNASKTKNMMVNIEYEKKLKELEAQMSAGQKLIRKASSATGIPEVELTGYKDACTKLVSDLPKVACKAATSAAAVGGFVILAKNYKKIVGALCSRQEAQVKKVEDAKTSVKGSNPQQEKEVISLMSSISKKYNEIVSTISLGAIALTKSGNEDKIKNAAIKTRGVSKLDAKVADVYSKARGAKEKVKNTIAEKKGQNNISEKENSDNV